MEENKIFVPHELKTIEIDVEKKIFRVNGEDFAKNCDSFSFTCQTGKFDEWFKVGMGVHTDIKYASYDFDGKKSKEEESKREELIEAEMLS